MNAVTGPNMESLPQDAHLLVPVLELAEREPDRPLAAYRVGPGLQWVIAAEFATRVRDLAKGLVASGVAPGDRVALMRTGCGHTPSSARRWWWATHGPTWPPLIAVDEEGLREWAEERGRGDVHLDALRQDPDVQAALQEAVDEANASVSRPESIRRFAVLPRDLSIEAGELTPTLKVRRAVVEKEYGELIDDLYAG
jgi:long-subunit acyl-CoA synthetase (AMP-forming)